MHNKLKLNTITKCDAEPVLMRSGGIKPVNSISAQPRPPSMHSVRADFFFPGMMLIVLTLMHKISSLSIISNTMICIILQTVVVTSLIALSRLLIW